MGKGNGYERKKIFYDFLMKIKNHVRVTTMRSMTTCQRIMILNDDTKKIRFYEKMA